MQALDNSNLLQTESNFCFPPGHSLYVFQNMKNQNRQCTAVQNVVIYAEI